MQMPTDAASDRPEYPGKRVLEAADYAREMLSALDDAPDATRGFTYYFVSTVKLEMALRELLAAIDAIAAFDESEASRLTLDEQRFAIQAGVDPEAFSDAGHRRAVAWLTWSAISIGKRTRQLNELTKLSAFDIVPGLAKVVEVFPDNFGMVEKYMALQTPRDELDGLTIVQWLLTGGDPLIAVELVEALRYE